MTSLSFPGMAVIAYPEAAGRVAGTDDTE